jgi:hypothetical protein
MEPREWLDGFLRTDDDRYRLGRAFDPCPSQDLGHDAVVSLFLRESFPPGKIELVARDCVLGVKMCADERALRWLLDALARAEANPRLASLILRKMRDIQHRSSAYAAAVGDVLRVGPPNAVLAQEALFEAARMFSPTALRDLFFEVYPTRRLAWHIADWFFGLMVRVSGDDFLADLVRLLDGRPEVIADPGFLNSLQRDLASDLGRANIGPGARALVQAIEARADSLGPLDRAVVTRLRELVAPAS